MFLLEIKRKYTDMSSIKHCKNNVAVSLRFFKIKIFFFKNKRSLKIKSIDFFDEKLNLM